MRTDILRKTVLTAAGLASTAGGIAGPAAAAQAAEAHTRTPTASCRPTASRPASAS